MIAIICAMSEELNALKTRMKDVSEHQFRPLNYHGTPMDNKYYIGKIGDKEVSLFHSGVGKVYAAIVTTQILESVKPELVINLGCAGSLNENVHVNDVVIANRVAHWDVDVPGWERNIQSDKISYACDGHCIKTMSSIQSETHIVSGPIVSSDAFIYKKSQVKEIKKYFPQALCGEMEGASIANTCYAYGVRFAIIRSISDETLISGNDKQFDFNLLKVCDTAAEICCQLIAAL